MSGEDDTPDYLQGVDQPNFSERDNFTVKTGEDGPLQNAGYDKYAADDDDDDSDEVEERPPLRVPWLLILAGVVVVGAFLSLFIAGVAATGTIVADAERAALSEAGKIARTVDEERKILDELGSRGANRAELMALFAAIDEADGHERGLAALEFTRAVDAEVAAIGDIRGSNVADRHRKLGLAQGAYEEALVSWDSAAGNPIGAIAVGVGLANPPPAH